MAGPGHAGQGHERGGASGSTNAADKAGANTGSGSGAGTGKNDNKRKAETQITVVEFADMDIQTLRRYCRVNKLKVKAKNHDDLVAAATKHWNSVNAKEVDTVAYFLFAVKHKNSVLKLTMPVPGQ